MCSSYVLTSMDLTLKIDSERWIAFGSEVDSRNVTSLDGFSNAVHVLDNVAVVAC